MTKSDFSRIQRLNEENYKKVLDFDCGYDEFNGFLLNKALNSVDSTTYLVFDELDESKVIGYFAISCSCIVVEIKGMTQIPAVEITMLALNKDYQSKEFMFDNEMVKYSEELMTAAIMTIREITDSHCAATHITAYSVKAEGVSEYYLENGFTEFIDGFFQKSNIYNQGCIPFFYNM